MLSLRFIFQMIEINKHLRGKWLPFVTLMHIISCCIPYFIIVNYFLQNTTLNTGDLQETDLNLLLPFRFQRITNIRNNAFIYLIGKERFFHLNLVHSFFLMGADISKTFSDDFFKKKGGILGFGGNSKEAFHNSKCFY